MSQMTPIAAVKRVAVAATPMAVFESEKPGRVLVVVASTVRTSAWIESGSPRLIGVFDRRANVEDVLNEITGRPGPE